MTVSLRITLALLCTAPLGIGAEAANGGETSADADTRAIMAEIVEALRVLLPLSLSDERFGDPDERATIERALAGLADDGTRLEAHAAPRDEGFAFLSHSLARDVREVQIRFAAGRTDEARFLLHAVTDNCVACHSRLPDDRPHPLGERIVDHEALAQLPLEERVQLEVATRQFDRALTSYETLFADPERSTADLDLTGHFEGYLEVCLRVRDDPERAIPVLESVAARADTPERVRTQALAWVASLRQLRDDPVKGPPLARARTLMDRAENDARFPADRRALVPYVAASAVLSRYVATSQPKSLELGEAYYLLGIVESHVGRSLSLSQTEHFFETAIRMAPSAPYASDAYAQLEEFTISGYTGSSGVHVPPDLRARLDELRALIEANEPPSPQDG